jgi:peptidyl-prolyl cis-trans isomerase B (cyclophilin B)
VERTGVQRCLQRCLDASDERPVVTDRMRWAVLAPVLALFVLVAFSMVVWGCGDDDGPQTTNSSAADGSAADTTNAGGSQMSSGPKVLIKTSLGDITAELDPAAAPLTVENFLSYVESGSYDGTIFHRVIRGFMIQGGGFTPDMQQKETQAPVKNEADNGLKNVRGTLAMARTSVVDSATSQFFVNVADNDFLDFSAPTPQGYGYAVFGRVVEGMDVVDAIVAVPTTTMGSLQDVPSTPVVIESVTVVQ